MRRSTRTRRKSQRLADTLCALLWMVALAALLVGAIGGVGRLVARQRAVPTVRLEVVPRGGTLWELAKRCGGRERDPRAVAVEIRRLNNLRPGEVLHPGERLLVPDYAAGATRLAQNVQQPG